MTAHPRLRLERRASARTLGSAGGALRGLGAWVRLWQAVGAALAGISGLRASGCRGERNFSWRLNQTVLIRASRVHLPQIRMARSGVLETHVFSW